MQRAVQAMTKRQLKREELVNKVDELCIPVNRNEISYAECMPKYLELSDSDLADMHKLAALSLPDGDKYTQRKESLGKYLSYGTGLSREWHSKDGRLVRPRPIEGDDEPMEHTVKSIERLAERTMGQYYVGHMPENMESK